MDMLLRKMLDYKPFRFIYEKYLTYQYILLILIDHKRVNKIHISIVYTFASIFMILLLGGIYLFAWNIVAYVLLFLFLIEFISMVLFSNMLIYIYKKLKQW